MRNKLARYGTYTIGATETLEQVNKELDSLEKMGVIEKIDSSYWVSPTENVKKNNKIRVCADFSTGLNECLRQYNYPLPNPEKISKLNGDKLFSGKLLTINTDKSLYKFNRLPFGIKVIPAILQVLNAMLA
ncbi:uncharacterized protein LOC106877872 [Octopus bimaculoides]|uniref:uncharacterized protein LOC106877872 n=1 Tax=Octopus bimaculoides TaxID=37653 RepID=UPI00071CC3AF|nr:uncharacterized protein LOC106877872 [Octopus bimaculoides]|eukprot:XP_014782394.1 PREDICTED: uncharacterized protein LOC106877872 [Octopus bimaculoides]